MGVGVGVHRLQSDPLILSPKMHSVAILWLAAAAIIMIIAAVATNLFSNALISRYPRLTKELEKKLIAGFIVLGLLAALGATLSAAGSASLPQSGDEAESPPADGTNTFVSPEDTDGTNEPTGVASTQLKQAHRGCSTGDLADGDRTLEIDVAGKEPNSGTATLKGFYCTLDLLKTPRSVVAKMESTSARDGMQSATWGAFEASWTYHPDDGVNVIITER